jgi:hypothetical protein
MAKFNTSKQAGVASKLASPYMHSSGDLPGRVAGADMRRHRQQRYLSPAAPSPTCARASVRKADHPQPPAVACCK